MKKAAAIAAAVAVAGGVAVYTLWPSAEPLPEWSTVDGLPQISLPPGWVIEHSTDLTDWSPRPSAASAVISAEPPEISWEAPRTNTDGTDCDDLLCYNIYADGALWKQTPLTQSVGRAGTITVTAVDRAGNESAPSASLLVIVPREASGFYRARKD